MKKFGSIFLMFLCIAATSCDNGDSDDDENISQNVDRSANLLGSGDSANDILSNTNFDNMIIEVGFVEGFRPTVTAMDGFVDYLKLHTFKEDIEVVYRELPPTGESELELQAIADLETENRTAYNDGSTLAIYIFFADAPSDGDDEEEGSFTLGAVYRNTSMVIYSSTVRKLAGTSSLVSVSDIEEATLNHEFGHLFGLVNLGTTPVNDHEDVDSANHCNVEGCLMRAELQFTRQSNSARSIASTSKNEVKSSCSLDGRTVLAMLEQSAARGDVEIPALDSECILDIQGNGAR